MCEPYFKKIQRNILNVKLIHKKAKPTRLLCYKFMMKSELYE